MKTILLEYGLTKGRARDYLQVVWFFATPIAAQCFLNPKRKSTR
jgi:hypothetical protein